MIILGLNHAQITIPNGLEEAARAFYCTVLGLPELPKPESLAGRGGFWLQVGKLQVHIGTEDNIDRQATKSHLAYEVDDVEEWRQLLLQNGVVILDSIPLPGFARFEFRDPFGNRVEFIQSLI
jgi:catechol 2,3-dioxygenase-like lactoylglutathione lyase family enzyme